jgi:hypothetical protein
MRRFLVSSFFADVTQQIHSFRASGVIAAHRLVAAPSDSMALRKSAGILWTAPPAIALVVMMRHLRAPILPPTVRLAPSTREPESRLSWMAVIRVPNDDRRSAARAAPRRRPFPVRFRGPRRLQRLARPGSSARPSGRRPRCFDNETKGTVDRLSVREDLCQLRLDQDEIGSCRGLSVVLASHSTFELREVVLGSQSPTLLLY